MYTTIDELSWGVQYFFDMDILPNAPDKKGIYVALGLLAPKLLQKYMFQYKEVLLMGDILMEDGRICLDEAEHFFEELLNKIGGFKMFSATITAEDVHKVAAYIREKHVSVTGE